MYLKKKVMFFSLALVLVFSAFPQVSHAKVLERNIKVWINDFYIMSDVHPFMEKGHTYVPIRFVAEELGYEVDWNGKDKIASISKGDTNIILEIGSNKVKVNNKMQYLEAQAKLKQGRTFVPFRAVAELFGENVEYDNVNKIAIIGDDFEANGYYPLKYYFENKDPFITSSKVNFVEYILRYSDGKLLELKSDKEIFDLIDKDGTNFKEVEFEREVEEDKRLYDKYYVAPIIEDQFVGSWHGTTKTIGTDDYYDNYVYIEKIGDNRYLYVSRAIKSNGSELVTESYATYDDKENILIKSRSHRTTLAKGDFTYSWYGVADRYKVENFNYMYVPSDTKMFVRKY